MKCKIRHESKGRMRVHAERARMTLPEADRLSYYLLSLPGVTSAKVYDRTCDAVITYEGDRAALIRALSLFSFEKTEVALPEQTGRALNREMEERLVMTVASRAVNRLFFPMPVRIAITVLKSVKFILKGVKSLLHGRMEVSVLDATAITVSMIRGDFDTASSIMFLLGIGEQLEDWTHKKSVDDLARTMSLGVERVWMETKSGEEVLVDVRDVKKNDVIVVRTGNLIPLDGRVVSGEAMVNQSTMTGEGLPVAKKKRGYVYAGTVVEEGDLRIKVDKEAGGGRYDRIVQMIEDSEKMKSLTEAKAEHLADHLVPYAFLGTALTYLFTRNADRALSFIMVDFSCALKLAMPVAVLSAMREAGRANITVKGGKFLEAVAEADTIVFDKTGTLTHATPSIAAIHTFDKQEEDEMLRLAACLEEHYPHSIANAVVREAVKRGLNHEERHAEVQYIVAHGIASAIDGKKVVLGSYHFVFEDEGVIIPRGEKRKFNAIDDTSSKLYLAIAGRLSAVICIEDPLRDEAADVVKALRGSGFKRIVMMTGDSAGTAAHVAKAVGVDDYYAEVLPEEKADFIRKEKALGHKVVMVGDGVNDSPALSEADAGIAVNSGAAIAREVADITITAEDLCELVRLKNLSGALMKRIGSNYRFIMSFNMVLIALGFFGILTPADSALFHNASTIAIGLKSMTDLDTERG